MRLRASMTLIPGPDQVSFFVGREKVVKQVLHELKDASKQAHLLCGHGGIGKSQLAVRLFDALIETGQCSHAFWLDCQTTEQLKIGCTRIAEKNIPGLHVVDKKDIKSAVQTIRERIETERCLLVFDDVGDCSDMAEFSPGNKGHVILTSRNSKTTDWSLDVKRWPIDGLMDEEDLVQFARKFSPKVPDPKDRDAKDCMEHLKTEFSGVPVIPAQFFSHCKEMGHHKAADRIENLRKKQSPGRKRFLIKNPNKSIRHGQSIVEVVRESLSSLSSLSDPDAIGHTAGSSCVDCLALLRSLAYLDPKNIPLELVLLLKFDESPNQVEDIKDCTEDEKNDEKQLAVSEEDEDVRDALALLERHSLTQWSRETNCANMHAVAQEMVRYLQPQTNIANLVDALTAFGGDHSDSHDRQEEWAAVLQHGTTLHKSSKEEHSWRLARALGQACDVACLCDEASCWFRLSAKLAETETKALVSAKSKTGKEPEKASIHNNIGSMHKRMGKYPEALAECKKCLDVRLKVHSTEKPHPSVATSYNNIGSVCKRMGKYPEALAECKKCLDVRLKVHGTEKPHPSVATSYGNIGSVHKRMGKHPEALTEFKKCLDIDLKVCGTEKPHPSVAASYGNIGSVHNRMGKYPEALTEFKKCLDVDLKVYGTEKPHPSVATSYGNIGGVCKSMGKYPEALTECKKSLAMKLKVCGTEKPHPSVATSYNNIGGVYDGMGKYPEAITEHEKALDVHSACQMHDDGSECKAMMSSLMLKCKNEKGRKGRRRRITAKAEKPKRERSTWKEMRMQPDTSPVKK